MPDGRATRPDEMLRTWMPGRFVPRREGRARALALSAALLLAGAAADGATSQPPRLDRRALADLVLETWNDQRGLPHDHVQAIEQTPDGYLWLGTEEGLVRFDGGTFTVFDNTNTSAFGGNSVSALRAAPDGTLWVGVEDGLLRYRSRAIERVPLGPCAGSGTVSSIAVAGDGAVWTGGPGGLCRIEPDGSARSIRQRDGLPSDFVRAIVEDRGRRLWVGTHGGLVRIEGDARTVFTRREGLPDDEVRSLHVDASDTLWVGTARGLARLDHGAVRPVAPSPVGSVRAIETDELGGVWLSVRGDGLWRVDGGAASRLTMLEGLPSAEPEPLFIDRSGSLWVGGTGGLARLRGGAFTTWSTRRGLASDDAWVVLQDRTGAMWFGTQAGLTRVSDGRATTFDVRDGLASSTVTALAETRDGVLWVGTRGGGLSRRRDGRFQALSPRDGLGGNDVRAILEDRAGALWVGAAAGGLTRFSGGRFRVYGRADGLRSDLVYALFEDRDGTLWAGCGSGGGICRRDGDSFRCFGPPADSPPLSVLAVHQTSDGVLWLGTNRGLARFANGAIVPATMGEGLGATSVWAIAADGNGHVWFTTNRGLARVSAEEMRRQAAGDRAPLVPVVYGRSDGLPTRDFSGAVSPALTRDRAGHLWAASARGIVEFDPAALVARSAPPQAVIDRIEIDRREALLAAPAPLPPGEGRLVVRYSAPDLDRPDRLRFDVRLEGFDADWVAAGARREAVYTNLPPGPYRFRVRSRNDEGALGPGEASFAFQLAPRVHQTWWFRAAVVAALGALLAGGVRLRLWRLGANERELRRRVEAALGQVKVLSGLIPICAGCKKIRDDAGYWNQVESYIQDHSQATFSHGMCPECIARYYPDYAARHASPPPRDNEPDRER